MLFLLLTFSENDVGGAICSKSIVGKHYTLAYACYMLAKRKDTKL